MDRPIARSNMISTIPEGHIDHDYQTASKGKRRRISKVSMSLGNTAAEDLRSEISQSIRKELSRRRSSVIAPEPQLKSRPTETANIFTAENSESAASKALNNFDLFEHILMQLPWSGEEVEIQRQSIRAIMTTTRTCRSFKGMIDASARLQKRLFLARDSEQKRPCYCGHQEEDHVCGAETNPFIAPTLKKHILHSSFSCDQRRQKQQAARQARADQQSLCKHLSNTNQSHDDYFSHPVIFRDLQDKQKKHMLAFKISENDPFYLLGERSSPNASWRNMYCSNPAPTRIELYYWSYLIRCESQDGKPLTAGFVWDTIHETLEVARQRKAPGYQYEGDEPLLVLLGSWEQEEGEGRHVYDWLNQRHEACGSPACRYAKV
ncbi:hypothetical protein D6C95_08914 [Aureobasidium pullulans]|nr:hypothetical protein D6C95_08914 [Aureobasidium pullulans]